MECGGRVAQSFVIGNVPPLGAARTISGAAFFAPCTKSARVDLKARSAVRESTPPVGSLGCSTFPRPIAYPTIGNYIDDSPNKTCWKILKKLEGAQRQLQTEMENTVLKGIIDFDPQPFPFSINQKARKAGLWLWAAKWAINRHERKLMFHK